MCFYVKGNGRSTEMVNIMLVLFYVAEMEEEEQHIDGYMKFQKVAIYFSVAALLVRWWGAAVHSFILQT